MRRHVLLLLCVAGCSSSLPPNDSSHTTSTKGTLAPRQTIDLTRETVVRQSDFAASRGRVWQALLASHEALGIPFANGDIKQGVAVFQVTNQLRTVAGKRADLYIDCGYGSAGPRVDSYRLTIKLTHSLENRTADATKVHTGLQAWARNPGFSSDPVPCNSRGTLENEISGMVTLRLQTP